MTHQGVCCHRPESDTGQKSDIGPAGLGVAGVDRLEHRNLVRQIEIVRPGCQTCLDHRPTGFVEGARGQQGQSR